MRTHLHPIARGAHFVKIVITAGFIYGIYSTVNLAVGIASTTTNSKALYVPTPFIFIVCIVERIMQEKQSQKYRSKTQTTILRLGRLDLFRSKITMDFRARARSKLFSIYRKKLINNRKWGGIIYSRLKRMPIKLIAVKFWSLVNGDGFTKGVDNKYQSI